MAWTAPAKSPDAAELRAAIYGRRRPERSDLVALLTLAAQADPSAEFLALVEDVARDVLTPEGEIGCADGDWLMEVCGDGAGLPGRAEFAALSAVLRQNGTPLADLSAFAAREIERAILTGERRVIGGEDGEPGRVLASDVRALEALCTAPDRALAEVLFDIAHATATADNAEGFDTLFARALRAYLARETPADARFEAFFAALEAGPPAPAEARAPPVEGFADTHYLEAANATSARGEAAALLPAGGARWAIAHLSRGALSPAERRLVAGLRNPDSALDRAA